MKFLIKPGKKKQKKQKRKIKKEQERHFQYRIVTYHVNQRGGNVKMKKKLKKGSAFGSGSGV